MALDITKTHTLLQAMELLTPASTFLRDRYFPTNEATDLFATNDVLVEYREGGKRVAPFVAPRKGGVTIYREGYTMQRYAPPNIAPRRSLTEDDLQERGFGEALYGNLTPEQRQATWLLKDAEELSEMISRREEAMAAETLLQNGCVMKHRADDFTKADEKEIRFYAEERNPAVYTPAISWDESGAKILEDATAMIRFLITRGLPATDLLVATDVADAMLGSEPVQQLLDLRNYHIGSIDPQLLPHGAALLAQLNIKGYWINVIGYDETYEDESGELKPFLPAGHVVLTAPNAGRTLYGAVTQVEQYDGQFHTYAARRVPKYLSNADGNMRSLTLTSRPLLVPNHRNPWISAKVLF